MILIYVNDILVTRNANFLLQQFTKRLNEVFSLKDLGEIHDYLVFEIRRDDTGMYLTQRKYIPMLRKSDQID